MTREEYLDQLEHILDGLNHSALHDEATLIGDFITNDLSSTDEYIEEATMYGADVDQLEEYESRVRTRILAIVDELTHFFTTPRG